MPFNWCTIVRRRQKSFQIRLELQIHSDRLSRPIHILLNVCHYVRQFLRLISTLHMITISTLHMISLLILCSTLLCVTLDRSVTIDFRSKLNNSCLQPNFDFCFFLIDDCRIYFRDDNNFKSISWSIIPRFIFKTNSF